MYDHIVYGVAALNIFCFVLFGWDKRCAEREKRRIPEGVLLGVSFLGGAVGGYLGMRYFHHKTRKPVFAVGIPVMIILHGLLIYFVTR